MAADPPDVGWYFNLLRQDFAALRKEMNESLGKLVSSETFRQEQIRVNEKFEALAQDIRDITTDLAKEVQVRVASDQTRMKEQAQGQRDQEKEAAARRWQIFGMFASPLITLIIGFVFVATISRLGGAP